jgi:Tol biopolymer transport system component
MYSINIYDPDAKPIIYFERPPGWYPAISPDGKRIAFGAPNQLIIFDRETGEIVATLPTEGRGLLLCWSPDGTKIAFGGFGSYGLWIFDMSKNKTIQIAEGYYTMPAWSKDGTKLAFDLRTSPEWSIWIIETDKLQGILNTE